MIDRYGNDLDLIDDDHGSDHFVTSHHQRP